jgi:hypothetical protein
VEQSLRDNDMIATPVRRLISRLPVMIEESATVQAEVQDWGLGIGTRFCYGRQLVQRR